MPVILDQLLFNNLAVLAQRTFESYQLIDDTNSFNFINANIRNYSFAFDACLVCSSSSSFDYLEEYHITSFDRFTSHSMRERNIRSEVEFYYSGI